MTELVQKTTSPPDTHFKGSGKMAAAGGFAGFTILSSRKCAVRRSFPEMGY
ncbi:hypothetical protein [Halopseudomonas xiamenensis]|uniref:hypothetical protein n=1 Tax=Halopseudomonas xiamenensis TaxID=157792 RepID=UPI001C8A2AAF|nr:hypothetical protein [Halopseudomonas xiamenensis]